MDMSVSLSMPAALAPYQGAVEETVRGLGLLRYDHTLTARQGEIGKKILARLEHLGVRREIPKGHRLYCEVFVRTFLENIRIRLTLEPV